MLAGVLLHVIPAAGPVYMLLDGCAGGDGDGGVREAPEGLTLEVGDWGGRGRR